MEIPLLCALQVSLCLQTLYVYSTDITEVELAHPGPFYAIFDLHCWGGQNRKKSRLRRNAVRGCPAICGTYFSAYLCGISVPPALPRLSLLPQQMWTCRGEIPRLRFKNVSKCSTVVFPCFTDIYLQVAIFFNLKSTGPLLLHPH